MNILFYGSAPTLGDAGIGFALLQDLKATWPDANLLILTSTPDVYAALPEAAGARFEDKPSLLPRAVAQWPGGLDDHLRYLHRLVDVRFFGGARSGDPGLHRTLRDYYGWADLAVHQGGPGWNDRFLNLGVLRQRLLRYAAAQHFGTPVALLAQSFGPFERTGLHGVVHNQLAAFVLNQVQLITARDLFSLDHLSRAGVRRPRIVPAADAALRLRPSSAARGAEILTRFGVPLAERERPLVGCSVRSIRPRYGYPDEAESRFRQAMAHCLDRVIEEVGDVVFMSTDYDDHAGYDNDLEVMQDIQAAMQHGKRVYVVDQPFMPQEIMAAYGHLDLFVGVRLHPTLFAITQGVPALSIGYAPKCRDFMEQMHMDPWHIPYLSFTAEEGFAKIKGLADARARLRHHIQRRLPVVQERSARSVRTAATLVGATQRAHRLQDTVAAA